MRSSLSTLAVVLLMGLLIGCRNSATGLSNPFLAPDRVPPPATRTLLPGTAQPYYPGDPIPNTPTIAQPSVGAVPLGTPQPSFQPGFQQTTPTFAPQGTVPPGGWNNTVPQPIPQGSGSSARNVLPNNVQPAAVVVPDSSVIPTPAQSVSPYPNQVVYQQQPTQQFPVQQAAALQPAVANAQPRSVRIRAISSGNLNGVSRSRDGFRPQGSSRVRKPLIEDRFTLRQRASANEGSQLNTDTSRFGFDSQFGWVRGVLEQSPLTGQLVLRYNTTGTDQFGGSLAIANPQVLGNLRAGDYVLLRGRIDQTPANNGTPAYNVSVVQRQRI